MTIGRILKVTLVIGIVALALIVASAGGGPSALAQVIPTATLPGQLALPTATPTIPGGPTATLTRTPTLTPVTATALGTPVNLRTGPGQNFDIVVALNAGDTVPVIGQLIEFPWLLVAWPDAPNGQAWVYAQLVQINGDITTVPVVALPAAPTIDPTLEAIALTSTLIVQTPGAVETATMVALLQPTGAFTVTPSGSVSGQPLPTFTPPPPFNPPTVPITNTGGGGFPIAVIIIALGAAGLLMVGLGLIRRLF
jgi:uncharacterized protein YraI